MKSTLKSCTCPHCVDACRNNPGWMTPDEAEAAINAGLAGRLMKDWYSTYDYDADGDEIRIFILCPASEGCEGDDGPEAPDDFVSAMFWTKGRCTFLNNQSRCEIHDSGFKPVQCRTALCCKPREAITDWVDNEPMSVMWNTDRGRAVVVAWEKAVRYQS